MTDCSYFVLTQAFPEDKPGISLYGHRFDYCCSGVSTFNVIYEL